MIKMQDGNGNALHEGDTVALLCEIVKMSPESLVIRVLNSSFKLNVSCSYDEVKGGQASSELLKILEKSEAN